MLRRIFNIISLTIIVFQIGCSSTPITFIDDRKNIENSKTTEVYYYSYRIPYLKYTTDPIDIDQACRSNNWNQIRISNGIWGTLVDIVSLGFIQSQKLTIKCDQEQKISKSRELDFTISAGTQGETY